MLIHNEGLGINTLPLQSLHLPPMTSFYLRKLLHHNLDRLTPISSQEGLPATTLVPPDPTLASTHLTRQLEHLVFQHQTLSSQGAQHRPTLHNTEQEIFRLLGFKPNATPPKATILIVDDTPELLRLLSTALSQQGYEVSIANSGTLALNRAYDIQPDLILLDIMMPGIDGYEVCERLKVDPRTCTIPIIFITAIDGVLDKVKAFNMGGVDYVTKPFHIEEVFSRIEHQLQIRDLQGRLLSQNLRLQSEIAMRQHTEDRYRHLLDSACVGTYQITSDGRFLSASTALAQICGYSTPAALMQHVTNVAETLYVRPQRRTEYIAYLNQYSILTQFESEIYCADGGTRWISENAHAVKDSQGNLQFYEGIVQDITVQRHHPG
jgi:adenylate cyclase